jgi:two-component system sensor histidine kinase MprB
MSLRWKIALAMASIVTVATVAVGVASYRSARERLLAEVDRSLLDLDALVDRRAGIPLPERGPLAGFDAQIVRSDGSVGESTFATPIPISDETLALIGRPRVDTFATIDTADGEYRVRSVGLQRGAVQVARPLDETNRVLQSLRFRTVLLVLLVAAAAILAGLWIAARVTASLRRLTNAAEHVEATGQLDVQVHESGTDEVGRLGVAFDRMLAALARSKAEQHRLVQDAGHELRTPLTSLRTNLDTLQRFPDLGHDDRDAIVADLHAETEELTELVNEIVAVASGDVENEPKVPFDLAELTREIAERYERRSGRQIIVESVPTPVVGQRSGVQRAVSSLLDNARKFDVSGGAIEITVGGGAVTVADRGPGIAEHELPLIFERFHRSDDARTLPGSGLGLAIVHDVARRHGGEAFAHNREGGGAVVGFRLSWPPPT